MVRRYLLANETALAITLATLGCAPPGLNSDADDGDETSGESGSDNVPFELLSASLDASGEIVVLHFSKPVAPVEGVNPHDFRISYAQLTQLCSGRGGCVDQTTYWDPNFYADDYLGYAPGSGDRFEVNMITLGAQATEVNLHVETPLKSVLCEYIAPYEDTYDFLFVHHAPGDIPLESADGESLVAIGPQFVHEPMPVLDVDGEFPNLDPKIPIPCSP